MQKRRATSAAGMTIVECLWATTILGATMLAATYTVIAGNQQATRSDRAARATRLARNLMEEIASMAYQDPGSSPVFGPEPGETSRTMYNDVDDYNGYSEALGALVDPTGTLYPTNDQQFTRAVTVAQTTQTVAALGGDIPGLTVTISLTHRSGEVWKFTRFIPKPAH